MRTLGLAAAAALALGGAAAPAAGQPRGGGADISCQRIETLPGGGFTFRMHPGLSILALARADGAFAWRHGGEVVGFSCLRRGGLPDVEEVEVLQAGYSLAVAAPGRDLRVVQLELKDGRVIASMIAGALEPADRRRLDAVVAAMQARIDRARR